MANPITQIILTAVDRTKAAFASAKGGIDSIGSAATGVSGLLRNLFAGLSVVYFIGKLRSVVDEMSNVSESAQRAGTSVENLTALQYAGKQSGIDDMQKSLVALSDALDSASTGTGEAARAFAALEIDPTQFDDPADALEALADRFAQLPDGLTKTNLAIDIFGKKIGPGMIPLLNEGASGIRALKEEAAALGKVLDKDAADAADKFGDNLERLKGHAAGVSQSVIGALLPSLNQYMAAMDDILKKGSALDKVRFFALGNINQDTLDRITSSTEKLAQAQEDLNRATAAAAEIGWGDTAYITKQRALVKSLEEQVAAENKAAKSKVDNAKLNEQAVKASEKAAEAREEEVKRFKESVNEQVADAERLQNALVSAYRGMLDEETKYREEAKRLRAQAASDSLAGQDQDSLQADAAIAALKLSRVQGGGNADEIRDQAKAVRDLAAAIDDQQKKSALLAQANLAEAAAADKSANAAAAQAAALAEQLRASEGRLAEANKAKADLNNPATLSIQTSAETDAALAKLRDIKGIIDYIKDNPVRVNVSSSGIDSSLRDAALQYGRR